MILEGIVTTVGEDGGPTISPMGPVVDREISGLVLRPFQTSRTFHNLKRRGEGVFHVTDNVEVLARAAINRWDRPPAWRPADAVGGFILQDACRWYAFRITELDDRQPRSRITCAIVQRGWQREFFGFNRAKHAVVEAAILATRTAILPRERILDEFQRLGVIVEKTCGDQERRAFQLLEDFVGTELHDPPSN